MRSNEEIAFLKSELCGRVADGEFVTDATRDLGIKHTELADWRKEDAGFRDSLQLAQDHLTEIKADELATIHERIADPKRATVASGNLKWWLAKRNPQVFGEKAERPDDQPELLLVLRAAIARAVQQSMLPAPEKLIELKPYGE